VIWLRVGNCTTTRAEYVLRNAVERLHAFQSENEGCLVLTLRSG
jgi:predicted nuclease of predicted toxin-antitoxin system